LTSESIAYSLISNAAPIRQRHGRKNWVGIPTLPLEALLTQLKTDPSMYVDEMADFLFQNGHKAYTPSQIWRALNSRDITRKVLEVHAKEQNEARRQEYLAITSIYTAEQRFYIDERYCNIFISMLK
jgi:hypothetical protein